MTVTEPSGSPIQILARPDGTFESIELVRSYLIDKVFQDAGAWSVPVVVYGQNSEDDFKLLRKQKISGQEFLNIKDYRPFLGMMRLSTQYNFLIPLFDLREYKNINVGGRAPDKAEEVLTQRGTLEDVVDLVRDGPKGFRKGTETASRVEGLIVEIDRLCNQAPLIVTWPVRFNIFPAFAIAIWLRRKRPYPLVIFAQRELNFSEFDWINTRTSALEFEDFARQVEITFGFEIGEIEKGYRVWQLSRDLTDSKPRATTPKTISLENARQFLSVLTKSRTENVLEGGLQQRAAPLIFDAQGELLGLRHALHGSDTIQVIQAGADSLRRQIERFQQELQIDNIVPSARGVLSSIDRNLSNIAQGMFDDGDVISIGVEFNAFQWHIDSVRASMGEGTLGEVIGLFATANLFLRRFPIWREYTGLGMASGGTGDGLAQFRIARDLLREASNAGVLSLEASQKVGVALSRVPSENSPPALKEGLVRSGENLAAITVNAVSEIATREAKTFGSKVKEEAYRVGSTALIAYAVAHADKITALATLQNWRWATWVYDVLKGLGSQIK